MKRMRGEVTFREGILAVYRGEAPDFVPYMLDLSHWFYHRNRLPWDLTTIYEKPETALIDYHKKAGVGFYMPNLASFYTADYGDDVACSVSKGRRNGAPEITWRLETPLAPGRSATLALVAFHLALGRAGRSLRHHLRSGVTRVRGGVERRVQRSPRGVDGDSRHRRSRAEVRSALISAPTSTWT